MGRTRRSRDGGGGLLDLEDLYGAVPLHFDSPPSSKPS